MFKHNVGQPVFLSATQLFSLEALTWSLLAWGLGNDKKQEQVWLHQIYLVASLSLESFPQRASGKLSENHLVVDANEPLWTPFPVCRCLWLSITFKMLNVEQMYIQPLSANWILQRMKRFSFFFFIFTYFPKAFRETSSWLSLWLSDIVIMRFCYKLELITKSVEVSGSPLLLLCFPLIYKWMPGF